MKQTSAASHHAAHANPVLGIVLKVASVFVLSAMVACVKALGTEVPAGQTVFFRSGIALAVVTFMAWRGPGLRLLHTSHWRGHAARSLAGTFSMFCWFTAISMIPLAEMTAISFTVPLFLTVLAMVFLGERIHWYRWTALAMGFSGVMIIVMPQLQTAEGAAIGVGIGVVSAMTAAFALMFLRQMSGREHALTITFYLFLTASSFSALTAFVGNWQLPDRAQLVLLLLTGLLGALGQLLMTYSYRFAEASLLAPLDYSSMLVAVAIGYYLFGEVPHLATWLGAPLIIAAGLIILWREYRKYRRDTAGLRTGGKADPPSDSA